MANQLYGYNPSYGGPGAKLHPSHSPATTTAVDAYYPEPARLSSRYLSSSDRLTSDPSTHAMAERVPSLYLNKSDNLWRSSGDTVGNGIGASGEYFTAGATPSQAAWSVSASLDPVAAAAAAALKRPTEALYHQSLLGSHNTIGQSDGWFSSNYLVKRPRFESASSLPIYPQRPGEKDCAHYMHTRTCKFGDSCKFDHPIWVPEGGIPDWKEVSIVSPSESLPERPGEPDCPYFVKTQKCKFGSRCKFNHPKDILAAAENIDVLYLPERPSEPPCAFYTKTGKCKFGASCKFNHPKDIQIPIENSGGEWTASLMTNGGAGDLNLATAVPVSPAVMHNSKGLPVRLGEVDCPFYMKMGSCKYGATCRYNHPDRYGQTVLTSPASNMNIGIGSLVQTTDPRLMGLGPTIYPQRPGQIECDYYMKTGECKYGERCRFHHPIDRSAPTPSMKQAAEHVKLTLAGLPRREGALKCPFYMKTGTCSYGAMCKFDHPPPGEVMAMGSEEP